VRPLFEFRVPPESYQHTLVRQPQPANSSRGLSIPSALEGSEVHFTRACPPATFRPQGLATLSTAYSLRARAGLVSSRQRSWDSPFGAFPSRKVSTRFREDEPTYRSARRCSRPGKPGWAGPAGRGSWAFTLPRVPGGRTGVNSPTTGCSLGLRPSRVLQRPTLPGISPGLLPRAFANSGLATSARRRLGVSIGTPPGPARLVRQAVRNWQDNPFRVPAPVRSRPFKRVQVRAMDSPHAASCVAADRPTIFGLSCPRSTSVARDRLRCRPF
jgi:hypothetical protein